MERVSRERLHQLTGLGYRTIVKRLQAAAVEPIERDGRSDLYDSEVALRAILLDPEADNGRPDLAYERALLAREQQTFYRLKNAVLAGDLIPKASATETMHTVIITARQQFLSLPSKLAGTCAGMAPPDIYELVDDEIRRILNALADGEGKLARVAAQIN